MASHALDQRLFEQTATLTDEHSSTAASGPERVHLIDGWLKAIADQPGTELVAEKLEELRDQLKLNHPDPDRVRELLLSLADSTSLIAQGSKTQEQTSSQLEHLATTLRQLAGVEIKL
jgi:hypothetical protein